MATRKETTWREKEKPERWKAADHHDVVWHPQQGLGLVVWTRDGTKLRRQLSPADTADLVRRLSGYLAAALREGRA
jgi:hypothetical protein